MDTLIYLLAVAGAVRIWEQNYQPWLASDKDTTRLEAPPFGGLLWRFSVHELAPDWSKKPWSCGLCMGFLIGIPLYLVLLVPELHLVLYALAGAYAAALAPEVINYLRIGS